MVTTDEVRGRWRQIGAIELVLFFLKTNQSAHVINERGAVRFWQNGNVASGDGLVLVSLDDAGATRKGSRVAGAPCRRPAGHQWRSYMSAKEGHCPLDQNKIT